MSGLEQVGHCFDVLSCAYRGILSSRATTGMHSNFLGRGNGVGRTLSRTRISAVRTKFCLNVRRLSPRRTLQNMKNIIVLFHSVKYLRQVLGENMYPYLSTTLLLSPTRAFSVRWLDSQNAWILRTTFSVMYAATVVQYAPAASSKYCGSLRHDIPLVLQTAGASFLGIPVSTPKLPERDETSVTAGAEYAGAIV